MSKSECHNAELTDAHTYYKGSFRINPNGSNWTVCSECGAALNPDGTLPKEASGG
jgi:hypothetical protein